MSLILKGIDMPKTEYEEVIIRIKHTGEVCDVHNIHLYAQAVEIPTPHGRLIDADKVFCYNFWDEQNLDNAPTILEAEE